MFYKEHKLLKVCFALAFARKYSISFVLHTVAVFSLSLTEQQPATAGLPHQGAAQLSPTHKINRTGIDCYSEHLKLCTIITVFIAIVSRQHRSCKWNIDWWIKMVSSDWWVYWRCSNELGLSLQTLFSMRNSNVYKFNIIKDSVDILYIHYSIKSSYSDLKVSSW